MGCSKEAHTVMDVSCSGMRICEAMVFTALVDLGNPCLKELSSYLEAKYTCVRGLF